MLANLRSLFGKLLPALGLAALGAVWAVVVSGLSGPALLDQLESWTGATLTYEQAIRAFVVTALAAFMALWAAHLPGKVTATRLTCFSAVLLACVGVTLVALFDTDEQHLFGSEFSWIRYATALFLVLTAATAAVIARGYARQGSARRHTGLWIVLAVAFVGLAADEILMIHEAFGDFIKARGASHLATDLVTVSYAFVALGLVAFLASQRVYLREYVDGHAAFVALFAAAAIVFLVGQMGDTFDMWTHDRLVTVAAARVSDGQLFSDFWYPLWGPKQFMNGIEEVLECIASALFCASFVVLLIERRSPGLRDRVLLAKPGLARVLTLIVMVAVTAMALLLARGRTIDSPVEGRRAVARVGPRDGLFHSDVVFHHPRWGLLIANEGGGNVIQYRDGRAASLPDPTGLVSDTDCVTATDEAIYVSSPSLNTIFKYTDESGYQPFVTAEHGLSEPEALVIVDSMMYVADETHHQLYAIDMATRNVRMFPLEDSRWSRPEGITYHPDLGRLLIADDVWGTLATVDFDGHAELFAYYTDGLVSPEDVCVTSDGRIFVADNGRREVIEFAPDGSVVLRIRFHRMHSYLVGVAVVEASAPGEKDMLYVVASDGFKSVSFMPSVLWEMELDEVRPQP